MKNKSTLDRLIAEAVNSMLTEQDAQRSNPDTESQTGTKISAVGAYGQGRHKEFLNTANSRAANPSKAKSLLQELGVSNASGKNDLQRAANVINQAINNNEIMKKAYGEPKKIVIDKATGISFKVLTEELDYRKAVKYLYITLLAAETAGLLRLDSGIKFVSRAQALGNPAIMQA